MVKTIPPTLNDGILGAERRRAVAAAEAEAALNPKVALARARRWRHHVVRVALGLAGLGVLLCTWIVYQRDQARVRESLLRIQSYVEPLQAEIKRIGSLPIYFPTKNFTRTEVEKELAYPSPEAITQLRKFQGSILLAYAKAGPSLFLQPKGRATVFVNGLELTLKWVSNGELAELEKQRDSFVEVELKKLTSHPPVLP